MRFKSHHQTCFPPAKSVGIFPGLSGSIGQLAFSLQASDTPLSICSSSGKMGHSLSLGLCDLATVVAKDAALADAAATRAANLIRTVEDVEKALNTMASVEGVSGLLIVKDGHVGLAGRVPPWSEWANNAAPS